MYQTEMYHAQVSLDCIKRGYKTKEQIQEAIFEGIYAKQLEPMTEEEVNFIADVTTLVISDAGEKLFRK